MNKNVVLILLIFLVPLFVYFGLSKDKSSVAVSSVTSTPEVIKFYSPMCYECQKLDGVLKEVFPKYVDKVSLNEIDVTQRNNANVELIKKYNIHLVPTMLFFTKSGKMTKRVEGAIPDSVFEEYLKEIINNG
mgnify:FL=1